MHNLLKFIKTLHHLFPTVKVALHYSSDWELAVAVILSTQTTDKQVNKVTHTLFKKYKKLSDYANSTPTKFREDIKSIGLNTTKAKNIVALAKIVQKKYGGKLPDTINELVTLPGIGRKTANVIMSEIHHNPVGITVDTHVRRFAIKFGLSKHKDPKRIEQNLMKIIPKKEWGTITLRLIEYGRQYCPARKHDCKNHPLTKLFPGSEHVWPKSK
ncbi:endonuclease III [Candidatus Falkowbacteria bacterium]|nr:endonuclease III [Candidatus Falkowbacteria bacterium]